MIVFSMRKSWLNYFKNKTKKKKMQEEMWSGGKTEKMEKLYVQQLVDLSWATRVFALEEEHLIFILRKACLLSTYENRKSDAFPPLISR